MSSHRNTSPATLVGRGAVVEGVAINLPSLGAACVAAIGRAERGEGFSLFTLNLDHLVKLASSAPFREAYRRADYVSADGWPIVWLARREGFRTERVCGADMVEPVCEAAARRGVGVYFIGPGRPAQAVALGKLRERYTGLRVVGAEAPRLRETLSRAEIAALAERVNRSGARICFISLGAPKQELIAAALAVRCPHVGFLCVGAALDFISGAVRRAPLWMQHGKLEWIWRLATDPRRLAWRYALCSLTFLRLVIAAVLQPVAHQDPATGTASAVG